jgi:2-dehydro-3-deoxyphosphogluconate aldolase/(4S)-4-hydroxy-2-oxoglutarate aldolase
MHRLPGYLPMSGICGAAGKQKITLVFGHQEQVPMTRYLHTESTLELMHRAKVIPVLTVADVADATAQTRALCAGGLAVLEITLRTPAALAAIAEIRKTIPEAFVGAGTITEAKQISAATEAGAQFLVSPGMTSGLREAALRSPVPFLPGIASVSEAMALAEDGFRALKFFPAEAAGGARYLSSLSGPLPDLVFCPTGGIDAEKAKTYLALKNVACVGGSWMVSPSLIKAGDFASIEKLAHEASISAHDYQ